MKTTKLINTIRSPEVMTRVSNTKWSFRFTTKSGAAIVFAVIDKKGNNFVVTERDGSVSSYGHFMSAISHLMDVYMAVERANDVEAYMHPKQGGYTYIKFMALVLLLIVAANAYRLSQNTAEWFVTSSQHVAMLVDGYGGPVAVYASDKDIPGGNSALDNCFVALDMYVVSDSHTHYSCKSIR